jgi:hypothetical protein
MRKVAYLRSVVDANGVFLAYDATSLFHLTIGFASRKDADPASPRHETYR